MKTLIDVVGTGASGLIDALPVMFVSLSEIGFEMAKTKYI